MATCEVIQDQRESCLLSEITADYSGPQSDSNPNEVQCLTKTGSAHRTSPESIRSYNPAQQKCTYNFLL